jgi:hypothetical protein
MNTFSVELPFKTEVKIILRTNDAEATEKQLHCRFADQRVRGEWFDLSVDDLHTIWMLSEINQTLQLGAETWTKNGVPQPNKD